MSVRLAPNTAEKSTGCGSAYTVGRKAEPWRRAPVLRVEMLTFLLWLLLLLLCWPLALAALVLYPIVWLISLPFRLVGITLEGVFRLLAALVTLPARLLCGPRRSRVAN